MKHHPTLTPIFKPSNLVIETIFWTCARDIIRSILLPELQDLGVRALNCFASDKNFRVKFGRATDMIAAGESANAVFRRELPRVDGEIRTRANLNWEANLYIDGLPIFWTTSGRFNLLRTGLTWPTPKY